jgi:hypothetical protein
MITSMIKTRSGNILEFLPGRMRHGIAGKQPHQEERRTWSARGMERLNYSITLNEFLIGQFVGGFRVTTSA